MYRGRELLCDNQGVMQEVVTNFLADKPKKTVWGNFRIEGDELIYRNTVTHEYRNYSYPEHAAKAKLLLDSIKAGAYELVNENNVTIEGIKAKLKEKNAYVKFRYIETESTVIAFRVKRNDRYLYVGNSSVLSAVGRTVSYGHVSDNTRQTVIQRLLEAKMPMIPFTVFEQAKLNVKSIEFVEQGKAEHVLRKRTINNSHTDYKDKIIEENVHFTGNSLFKVGTKYFLFDLDRREVKHKIFNPFLSEIPGKPKTIAEAYSMLKPDVVKRAEANGLEVKRQGEWFFIPSPAPLIPKLSEAEQMLAVIDNEYGIPEWLRKLIGKDKLKHMEKQRDAIRDRLPKTVTLRAGNNRPNTAELGLTVGDKTYIKGHVKHSGREHADLRLTEWHVAVPNTAVNSFTITGDID